MTRNHGLSFVRRVLVLGCQYTALHAFAALVVTAHVRADGLPDLCTAPGQPCGGDTTCTCEPQQCVRQVLCSSCSETVKCGYGGRGGTGGHSADDDAGQLPSSGFCTAHFDCNRCRRSDGSVCLTGSGKSGRGGSGGRGGMSGSPEHGGAGGAGDKADAGGAGGAGDKADAGVAGSGGASSNSEGCGCSSSGAAAAGSAFYFVSALLWALRARRRSKGA